MKVTQTQGSKGQRSYNSGVVKGKGHANPVFEGQRSHNHKYRDIYGPLNLNNWLTFSMAESLHRASNCVRGWCPNHSITVSLKKERERDRGG